MRARRIFTRRTEAQKVREEAAELAALRPYPDHLSNGEENQYSRPLAPPAPWNNGGPSYIANFSKGLPHNFLGEVDQNAYLSLLRAIYSGNPDHFEQILLDFGFPSRKLVNPQAGLAFDLEGPDAQAVTMPPAPRIDSAENSSEMAELYWMAVCRDVNFNVYPIDPRIAQATQSLSEPSAGGEFTDFRGPKVGAAVTSATVFRGFTPGDLAGPYISQFLLKPILYGTLDISQQQRSGPAGDFLTTYLAWWMAQNGFATIVPVPTGPNRFICTLRDLANYVHFDALYEAYLNACLILLNMQTPFDQGNPYPGSRTQEGFGTFGSAHILTLVAEVATRALKAVWFQKWGVHRRLRPEEFGGRIHIHLQGFSVPPVPPGRYPMINSEILASLSPGMLSVHFPGAFGTFLLPQAYEEGAPTHPAYGAGHAAVAGACVTILKAWFDESFVIPNPQVPDHTTGCTTLIAAPGAPSLTVGGELNKLAGNMSLGRNAAGVHWRSDYTAAVKLGEEIAIGILQEQKLTYNEDHFFMLTRFDGKQIVI